MYEVATAFPTGAGIDDIWDFVSHITYSMLLDQQQTMSLVADFEAGVFPRFDPTVALAATGPVAKFFTHVMSHGIDKTDGALLKDFSATELAPEFCSLLTRVLPRPDPLCDLGTSSVSHVLTLVRHMVAVNDGKATQLSASNVSCFAQFHELLRLVVGSNMGPVAALGMLLEITRLALDGNGSWTTVNIDQVATAVGALEWLLPTLRNERVRPPTHGVRALTLVGPPAHSCW